MRVHPVILSAPRKRFLSPNEIPIWKRTLDILFILTEPLKIGSWYSLTSGVGNGVFTPLCERRVFLMVTQLKCAPSKTINSNCTITQDRVPKHRCPQGRPVVPLRKFATPTGGTLHTRHVLQSHRQLSR
jgi:hypothetical protein